MNPSRRNRLVLILIFALFLAPLVAAVLLQSDWADYAPEETVNRGELLEPPVALAFERVGTITGTTDADDDRNRWRVVQVESTPCDAACEQRVTDLRQVHLATGRHQDEVAIVLVGVSGPEVRNRMLEIYGRFQLATDTGGEFEASLATANGAPPLPGTALIADPEGNALLRYAPGYDRGDLNKDLTKLLKWSGR